MLRLLRRSNSNRSNCSSETVVIPNANLDRSVGSNAVDGGGRITITPNTAITGSYIPIATKTASKTSAAAVAANHNNRYSMVESCSPSASTRAKDLELHRRYRPHSQARRLRKTRQVRIFFHVFIWCKSVFQCAIFRSFPNKPCNRGHYLKNHDFSKLKFYFKTKYCMLHVCVFYLFNQCFYPDWLINYYSCSLYECIYLVFESQILLS